MNVEVTAAEPAEVEADVLALAADGLLVRQLDRLFDGRLVGAAADADPVTMVQVGRELRAQRVAVVRLDELEPEGLRTAAARVVGAQHGGGTVAWALDESLPFALYRQVQAVVEGSVLGAYRADRWKSDRADARDRPLRRLLARSDELREVAARAELVRALDQRRARARRLALRTSSRPRASPSRRCGASRSARRGPRSVAAGLPALAAGGRVSASRRSSSSCATSPRARPSGRGSRLIGKTVTFDAGGYFLKPQSDIVRQKGDMAVARRCSPRSARSPSSSCRCPSLGSSRPART
jgi:leucyl aminopeptidase